MVLLSVRYGHDAGAAIVVDGKIIADVAEERFTRIKNDGSFPFNSIDYCLKAANVTSDAIDGLVIPTITFQKGLFSFFDFPRNIDVVVIKSPEKAAIDRNNIESNIVINKEKRKRLEVPESPTTPTLPIYQEKYKLNVNCKVYLVEHHLAHAASVCFTSGNGDKAVCITADGVGDNVATAIWRFKDGKISCLDKYDDTSSLGWFYGTATEAVGWRQSRDEWKMMGLAPFGSPEKGCVDGFYPIFKDGKLKKKHKFPKFGRWNDHGANHYHCEDSLKLSKIVEKVGWKNYAAEVQRVSEEQILNIVKPWLEKEQVKNLYCAGGFFLNVKANQRIWYECDLEQHWVYPNAGDNGLPVGAALLVYHHENPNADIKNLDHLYKGPSFSNDEIKTILDDRQIRYEYFENIAEKTAELLTKNYVIGWFQGRMESGPRALGNRSILMSPLREENRDIINKKIKYRETFRPFCPSIIDEYKNEYLMNPRDAKYMVISFKAKESAKKRIPAVIHVDKTARPQFVSKDQNSLYYSLINEFGNITGEYAILNTSLNIKGEPVICTPREAIKCFYDTGMDVMVLGNYILKKESVLEG